MKALGIEERKRQIELKNSKTRLLKSDKIVVRDPFEIFGHGVTSYFAIIRLVMLILFLISVTYLPIMHFYQKG